MSPSRWSRRGVDGLVLAAVRGAWHRATLPHVAQDREATPKAGRKPGCSSQDRQEIVKFLARRSER
jgi:hypothetical protein